MIRHILITGPSGAGKTTLAVAVARQAGLPLASLDKFRGRWGDYLSSCGTSNPFEIADWIRARSRPGPERDEHDRVRRSIVLGLLARLGCPHVVEGSQLISCPGVLDKAAQHTTIVLTTSYPVCVARRTMRWQGKRRNRAELADVEGVRRMAGLLYQFYWLEALPLKARFDLELDTGADVLMRDGLATNRLARQIASLHHGRSLVG